ncbi:type II toxin-antitoxin system VapC family toxin [Roseateles sp.]|uniref:type II toxin-antitoxin system VapC family toxin n=1 Tax=Roseateles sp. TaxID=1971397 RepID=UPI0031DB2D48
MIDRIGTSSPPDDASAAQFVVDTSAWIEWIADSDLGRLFSPRLARPEQCIVPKIVQLELSKWARRELSEEQHDRILQLMQRCQIELLDSETALLAASANAAYKLATADAVIYATALRLGVQVLTCDAHFKELPAVVFHPKCPAPRRSLPAACEPHGHWDGWPKSRPAALSMSSSVI